MKTFSIDLSVSSLKMRLVAIGFVNNSHSYHYHPFQHRHNPFELQFVIKGYGYAKIGENLLCQKEEEVYLISPGVYHSQKDYSTPFEKMCIMFEFPAPPIGLDGKDIYLALSTMKYFCCRAGNLENTLLGIKSALSQLDVNPYAEEEIRILTELLIIRLIQRISVPDEKAKQISKESVERAYLIDEFFNKNFHRNDGDELLANILGVSIRQLNRILKNLYGLNFRDKLKEIRLEVAIDLLAAGKSITEISEITGYSCPANFSTFIKNTTGNTPTELKRRLK